MKIFIINNFFILIFRFSFILNFSFSFSFGLIVSWPVIKIPSAYTQEPQNADIGELSGLPDELLVNIFSYLTNLQEISNVEQSCKKAHQLLNDQKFWKDFLIYLYNRYELKSSAQFRNNFDDNFDDNFGDNFGDKFSDKFDFKKAFKVFKYKLPDNSPLPTFSMLHQLDKNNLSFTKKLTITEMRREMFILKFNNIADWLLTKNRSLNIHFHKIQNSMDDLNTFAHNLLTVDFDFPLSHFKEYQEDSGETGETGKTGEIVNNTEFIMNKNENETMTLTISANKIKGPRAIKIKTPSLARYYEGEIPTAKDKIWATALTYLLYLHSPLNSEKNAALINLVVEFSFPDDIFLSSFTGQQIDQIAQFLNK